MKTQRLFSFFLLTGALLFLPSVTPAHAQAVATSFHVSLDTTPLQGSGEYFMDFQFLDGEGIGNGTASATVSNLTLTNGTLLGATAQYFGSASGAPDQVGGLLLTDSDPSGVAEFTQGFLVSNGAAHATIDFDVVVTAITLDSFGPDTFNFLILGSDRSTPLPTTGPGGAEFVSLVLDSTNAPPNVYGTDSSSPVALTPPEITDLITVGGGAVAPEPGSLLLLLPMALPLLRRRTMQRRPITGAL